MDYLNKIFSLKKRFANKIFRSGNYNNLKINKLIIYIFFFLKNLNFFKRYHKKYKKRIKH